METRIFEHADALSEAVARTVAAWINANPGRLLCLAAGDTPLASYAELVALQDRGEVDLSSVYYVGLDEWVGLGMEDVGSCRQVMHDAFYAPAGIPDARRRVFDGLADPTAECLAVGEWIEAHGGIGLTVLGVGMNGHVGFNEPGPVPEGLCRVVELDETTRTVSAKYFDRPQPVHLCVTVNLPTLAAAERIVLMLSGERKRKIFARLGRDADGKDQNFPASLLMDHTGLVLFSDRETAGA